MSVRGRGAGSWQVLACQFAVEVEHSSKVQTRQTWARPQATLLRRNTRRGTDADEEERRQAVAAIAARAGLWTDWRQRPRAGDVLWARSAGLGLSTGGGCKATKSGETRQVEAMAAVLEDSGQGSPFSFSFFFFVSPDRRALSLGWDECGLRCEGSGARARSRGLEPRKLSSLRFMLE